MSARPNPVSPAPFVSRSLADLHPLLREKYLLLETLWNARFRFRRLIVTCTWRNAAAQAGLYAQGRTTPGKIVTWLDGITQESRHQAEKDGVPQAEALDVAVRLLPGEPGELIVKPTVSWNVALYRPLLALAQEVGLVSGGGWRKPDWPHLELPWEVT